MSSFKYQLTRRAQPASVSDYRELARRSLPDMIWAYIDYGADDLVTLAANEGAYRRYALKSRVLSGAKLGATTVHLAAGPVDFPVLLAPTGLVGLSHWTGELGAAQAAERAGTLSIVSIASTYTFEEIASATSRPHAFQLYPWLDESGEGHDLSFSLIDRAEAAGYQAMFVTVDVPVIGNRESERKRGMGKPPILTPARVIDTARRPSWCVDFFRHGRVSARNLVDATGPRAAIASLSIQLRLTHPTLSWQDVEQMRERWQGPLYIKGILDADDAQRAVDLGANGVVVSNHGGRQLDGTPASLDALPAIAARVGDRAEVLLDGGIRRGSDIVKSLCLGADAVCIGRPYLYAMAAAGPAGAEHMLNILRDEFRRTLTLMGVTSLDQLGPSWLLPAGQPIPVADSDSELAGLSRSDLTDRVER